MAKVIPMREVRCVDCGRKVRARGAWRARCAACAEFDAGDWVPTHWRDTIGLWAFVALGCALWVLALWELLP